MKFVNHFQRFFWAPVFNGSCQRWWIPLMSKQANKERWMSVVFHGCIQALARGKKYTVLAGVSCTQQWDILQLEALLKQVGTLPRKSQSNIFSHIDEKLLSALSGSRLWQYLILYSYNLLGNHVHSISDASIKYNTNSNCCKVYKLWFFISLFDLT